MKVSKANHEDKYTNLITGGRVSIRIIFNRCLYVRRVLWKLLFKKVTLLP